MKCACGQELHYRSPATKKHVERQIELHGPTVVVLCMGRRYLVDRHYIALHGLNANELESLAEKGIIQLMPAPEINFGPDES